MGTDGSSTVQHRGRWRVEHVAETGSTNADLLARARAGEPGRLALVAGHQTAGRGRLDRTWTAPPGANLLVSLLVRGERELARPHELTQRVAVAAVEAVEAVTAGLARPRLKWPNDLLLDGAKLGGILAEACTANGRVVAVVVGLGVNLGWAPDGAARVPDVAPAALLATLLDRFDDHAVSGVRARYLALLDTLGQAVRVERVGDVLEGVAVAVDDDGALHVRVDRPGAATADVVVTVGDVVHLRPV